MGVDGRRKSRHSHVSDSWRFWSVHWAIQRRAWVVTEAFDYWAWHARSLAGQTNNTATGGPFGPGEYVVTFSQGGAGGSHLLDRLFA